MNASLLPTSDDQLLTTDQVAAFLGVMPSTLVNWRCTGRNSDLPYIRVGRLIRYRLKDIKAWIEKHCVLVANEGLA